MLIIKGMTTSFHVSDKMGELISEQWEQILTSSYGKCTQVRGSIHLNANSRDIIITQTMKLLKTGILYHKDTDQTCLSIFGSSILTEKKESEQMSYQDRPQNIGSGFRKPSSKSSILPKVVECSFCAQHCQLGTRDTTAQ